MIHVFYSNTDLKAFKDKFREKVVAYVGPFRDYRTPIVGVISGNGFEVRSGYIGGGRLSLFAPVIAGDLRQSGKRIMVTLTPRLGGIGIMIVIILGVMSIFICGSSLLDDNDDRVIRGLLAGILVPAFFVSMGFFYYYSKSKELIRDLKDKLDLVEG